MDFTSFISIRPSLQDPSKWAVTSHTYNPARSESRVEVVALSKLFSKSEATQGAYKESEKRGCRFVPHDTGVIAIKTGNSSLGKTYQVVGLLQDGDVFPFSEQFTTKANRSCLALNQSGLAQSMDRADRLSARVDKIFIPPNSVMEIVKQTGTPWQQTLYALRQVSNMPPEESEPLREVVGLAMGITSMLPQDLQDGVNKIVADSAREFYLKSCSKDQRK